MEQRVTLNVGGHRYETYPSTLTMVSPYFQAMLSKSFDHTGESFIDRDGTLFRHILHYCRVGKDAWVWPKDASKAELLVEFDFFGITPPPPPKLCIIRIRDCPEDIPDVIYRLIAKWTDMGFTLISNEIIEFGYTDKKARRIKLLGPELPKSQLDDPITKDFIHVTMVKEMD